jgi:tetratricopeptide (TPR) repeat protein
MAGILQELGVDTSAPPLETPDSQAESEVLQFEPKEVELELAAAEAEKRKASAPERIRLWLELGVLHRTIAQREGTHQKRARLKQAEMMVRRALEIAAQAKDTLGYIASLDALAEVFTAMKNYSSSEKLLQEGIRLEASLPHPDPLRSARRIHYLGIVRHRAGKSDDAVPALEKAVQLHEQNLGANHDETMSALAALGAVHRARGRHDLAQRCLHYAVRHFQNAKGASASESIENLAQLAGSFEDAGDHEHAAAEYERMLVLIEREVGRNQEDIGEMQFSVASVYIRWGDYTRARELLGECLGTFRRGGGPRLAVGHEVLAHVEEALGHYSDAVRELATAAKAWAKCGNRQTELCVNMTYRAELLDQLKRTREAGWLREQVAELEAGRTEFVEQLALLRTSSA